MARTEAYKTHLAEAGASFSEWQGAEIVSDFGDPDAEYRAATEAFGVADRSERSTVVATGTEAVPLLQGLVLGDVFALANEGSGQVNAAVNVKGRYVCELRLLHVPDLLLIDLEAGLIDEGALSHFKRQVINEDARFIDRSDRSAKLLLVGPDAGAFLDDGEWMGANPTKLDDYDGTWGVLAGEEAIAQRLPDFGVDAWEVLVDTSAAKTVWEAATSAGAEPVGNDALEVARIETGIPRWGVELNEKVIPLEAGMSWMVSFNKGCYLGQEIIARLDTLGTPAKELRRIELGDVEPPPVGAEVTHDGKKVGELIASIRSPRAGESVALGYVKRKHNDPGTTIEVAGVEGTLAALGDPRAT